MLEIVDCEQNTEEWYRARCGVVTASEFHTVLASGKGGGESKTRRAYMMRLAGEIITGEPAETYSNANMVRGHVMEDEARDFYALMEDVDPVRVGFIRNGAMGCSPDSLVSTNRVLEIKTKQPNQFIDALERYRKSGEMPAEHKAQCQGILWITEREHIDLSIYWPKMPTFIVKANRDEPYIEGLARAVRQFNEELQETIEWVRRFGIAA